MVFNCVPDSVMAYHISKLIVYEIDSPTTQWTINIWWADGRETELQMRDDKDVEQIAARLEKTVRHPPAVSGFCVQDVEAS